MFSDVIRTKLQTIIRGELQQGQTDTCAATRNFLCQSFGSSPTVKGEFESKAIIKKEQVGKLRSYAQNKHLWLSSLPSGSQYLTEGGESKVFLAKEGRSVIKVNDAGYYATWTEYFNSLALHNLLFPNTTYSLSGFIEIEDKFFAVVEQPFVEGHQASLDDIDGFLHFNGFKKTRRQDYYNGDLKIALEDMHDENVIAKEGVLFFIDTVFYIMSI